MRTRSVVQRRMYAQMLWGAQPVAPEEVVSRLGAVQAQELPVARWSVGQRTRRGTRARVDAALSEGRILRTHVLRPTWHFVVPVDIHWMLRLTGPRISGKMAVYDRQLELDAKVYSRTNAVIRKAVEAGHSTRAELGDALEKAKIIARGQRLNHIVMRAELDGIITSGAPRGKRQTYASLEERAPRRAGKDHDEAVAELARRYFISHGPATIKDFVWWSGLTQAAAREGLALLESSLASENVEGRTYWFAAGARSIRERKNVVDLVQIYDEIGIAYSESRDVLLGGGSGPRAEGSAITHAILLDGRYVGEWRTSAKTDWTDVGVSLRKRLTKPQRDSLERAIERYRDFMGTAASTRAEG